MYVPPGKLSADAIFTCMMEMEGEWFSKTTAVDMFSKLRHSYSKTMIVGEVF